MKCVEGELQWLLEMHECYCYLQEYINGTVNNVSIFQSSSHTASTIKTVRKGSIEVGSTDPLTAVILHGHNNKACY